MPTAPNANPGLPIAMIQVQLDPSTATTGFQPLGVEGGQRRCSTAQMSLTWVSGPPTNPPVRLSGSGSEQTIAVADGGQAFLSFTIASQDPGVSYFPVGLITREIGGNNDASGHVDFPYFSINNGVLTLDVSDPQGRSFNFMIVIERSTDGEPGVIDPLITSGK